MVRAPSRQVLVPMLGGQLTEVVKLMEVWASYKSCHSFWESLCRRRVGATQVVQSCVLGSRVDWTLTDVKKKCSNNNPSLIIVHIAYCTYVFIIQFGMMPNIFNFGVEIWHSLAIYVANLTLFDYRIFVFVVDLIFYL